LSSPTPTSSSPAAPHAPPPPIVLIENPLWPGGISEADVDSLVREILRDPSINIAGVPDFLERQVYKSTVKVVLNAIYRALSNFQGKSLPAGHELKLGRFRQSGGLTKKRIRDYYLEHLRDDTDDALLEQVADRLLENQAVNQKFLPDRIEHQLYVSCLKLVFRLIGMVAASLRVTVCGHELRLAISRQSAQALQVAAANRAALTTLAIDVDHLHELAEQAGLSKEQQPWLFGKQRRDFQMRLHAALFGLILSILDDMFAHTKIELLSDRIYFDIVPSVTTPTTTTTTEEDMTPTKVFVAPRRRQGVSPLSFCMGTCVGVLLCQTWSTIVAPLVLRQGGNSREPHPPPD
jgi:hypothetical protein